MSTWREKVLFFFFCLIYFIFLHIRPCQINETLLNGCGEKKIEARLTSYLASNICFLHRGLAGRSDVLNRHRSSQSVQHQAKSLEACETRGSSGCSKAGAQLKMTFASFLNRENRLRTRYIYPRYALITSSSLFLFDFYFSWFLF